MTCSMRGVQKNPAQEGGGNSEELGKSTICWLRLAPGRFLGSSFGVVAERGGNIANEERKSTKGGGNRRSLSEKRHLQNFLSVGIGVSRTIKSYRSDKRREHCASSLQVIAIRERLQELTRKGVGERRGKGGRHRIPL